MRHFLQKMCMHITLDNVLQFCLSFLRSLLFYFLTSLMAFSGPWKCRNCKFVGISSQFSSLWLTCFPVAKISKAQWDRNKIIDTTMKISVVQGQPLLLYSEYEPKKAFLSTSLIGSFTLYKHSPTSGFQIII